MHGTYWTHTYPYDVIQLIARCSYFRLLTKSTGDASSAKVYKARESRHSRGFRWQPACGAGNVTVLWLCCQLLMHFIKQKCVLSLGLRLGLRLVLVFGFESRLGCLSRRTTTGRMATDGHNGYRLPVVYTQPLNLGNDTRQWKTNGRKW